MKKSQRERDITRVSTVGIVANGILGVAKAIVGVLTHSIAIITDAVNNLTDTSSSIITIVGTHLATRRPDTKHPFGYGRVEYLTSLVIGLIVFFTGVEMCRSSIDSIIHPDEVDFDWLAVIVLGITVVVKILLGAYTLKSGKRLESSALVASGLDARSDAVATGAVLAAALLYIWTGISVDAWVGALISLYIVKTGYDILKDTVSKIVGEATSHDLTSQIYAMANSVDIVKGAFDLALNSYGPDHYIGSINVEVDHDVTAEEICRAIHHVQQRIARELRATVVFGIYAVDKSSPRTMVVAQAVKDFCDKTPGCGSYHGLFVDDREHKVYCDVVVDYDVDRDEVTQGLAETLTAALPGYTPEITADSPFE